MVYVVTKESISTITLQHWITQNTRITQIPRLYPEYQVYQGYSYQNTRITQNTIIPMHTTIIRTGLPGIPDYQDYPDYQITRIIHRCQNTIIPMAYQNTRITQDQHMYHQANNSALGVSISHFNKHSCVLCSALALCTLWEKRVIPSCYYTL